MPSAHAACLSTATPRCAAHRACHPNSPPRRAAGSTPATPATYAARHFQLPHWPPRSQVRTRGQAWFTCLPAASIYLLLRTGLGTAFLGTTGTCSCVLNALLNKLQMRTRCGRAGGACLPCHHPTHLQTPPPPTTASLWRLRILHPACQVLRCAYRTAARRTLPALHAPRPPHACPLRRFTTPGMLRTAPLPFTVLDGRQLHWRCRDGTSTRACMPHHCRRCRPARTSCWVAVDATAAGRCMQHGTFNTLPHSRYSTYLACAGPYSIRAAHARCEHRSRKTRSLPRLPRTRRTCSLPFQRCAWRRPPSFPNTRLSTASRTTSHHTHHAPPCSHALPCLPAIYLPPTFAHYFIAPTAHTHTVRCNTRTTHTQNTPVNTATHTMPACHPATTTTPPH